MLGRVTYNERKQNKFSIGEYYTAYSDSLLTGIPTT